MLDTIYVCTHALDRWRERAAARLDEGEQEVIQKLRDSRKLAHDDYLPVPRLPNTHYYHHKECDAYFVVEPINRTSCRIITVIVPEPTPKIYIYPKNKVKKVKPVPAVPVVHMPVVHVPVVHVPVVHVPVVHVPVVHVPESEVRIHITPAHAGPDTLLTLEKVMQRVMPEEKIEKNDQWKDRVLDYRRYVNMMHEIESRLGKSTKNQPIRKQLLAQLTEIKRKLSELKPDYSMADNDDPIRVDGSVNYVSAIRYLIKKTDEQQKEIDELKTAVAFLSAK